MKKFFALLSLIILFLDTKAQLNLQWAKRAGGSGQDGAQSMVVDVAGNVITTGNFSGTVDFDPGVGVFTLTASGTDDIFVSKLDASGNFIWAKQLASLDFATSYDIATDPSGNVLITGIFVGTVDFDPGPSTNALTATGSNDIFVCKLDLNGSFIWADRMGGNSGNSAYAYSIATDATGNVFTTGLVNSTGLTGIDLDPGSGVYAVGNSNGSYVCKLYANGTFAWAAVFITTDNVISNTSGKSVAVDPLGNVLLTGAFSNTVDFDPGTTTNNLISTTVGTPDIYVCKLSNSGSFLWAKSFGNTNSSGGTSIISDALGNVYANGRFTGLMDFDPGPSTYTLNTANFSFHAYYLKLDALGNFLWARSVGGTSNGSIVEPYSLAVDMANNLYSTGKFNATADFDPGVGTYTMDPSSGGSYILKLDTTGSFVWVKQTSALFFTFWVSGRSISVDANLNVYLAGLFYTCDFDFNTPVYTLTAAGAQDMFAAKYCQVPNQPKNIAGSTFVCTGASLTFSTDPVYGASTYSWSLPSGLSGTSSTNSITTVAGGSGGTLSIFAVNACGISPSRTLAVIITPSLTVSANNSVICAPGPATLIASGASSYTWNTGASTNSIIPFQSATTVYTVTGSAPGCANTIKTVTVSLSPINLTVSASSNTVCSGQTVTLSASGAPSYSWSTAATTSAVVITGSASATTNYTVRGTNGSCTDTKTLTVTSYPSPAIITSSYGICIGSTFTMTPSGAATYTFSSGSAIVSPTSNTTYSVTGTSAQGCTSFSPGLITIIVFPLPVISANDGTVCAGKVFTMNPSGANTYTFSSGSSTVIPSANNSYTITGTSLQGCTSASPAISSVTVLALPVINVNSGSICAGQVFTIVPTGAPSYSYSGNSSTVSPISTSNYSVWGTDASGCQSLPAISSVTVNALPLISINSGSICAGGTFTMTPSGALSYTFSNGSATVSPSTMTSYSITGTGPGGCVSSQVVCTVTVHPLPVINVNSGTICAGGIFTLVPSGAITYTIANGGTTVSPASNTSYSVTGTGPDGCISLQTTATVTVYTLPAISVNSGSICAGQIFTINPVGAQSYSYSSNSNTVSPSSGITNYSVTGTDLFGCISPFAISTVTTFALPVVTVNSGSICTGETFTILPTGAVSYSYSSVSATVSPLSNSTYSITGTSPEGCVSLNAISSVTVATLPNVTISSSSPSICVGETTTLTGSGALSYTWSGGETTDSITVSPSATLQYTVLGIDSNGCKNSSSLTQFVDICLGIDSQIMRTFKLYPNPNAGELTIETETSLEIDLINSLGEFVSNLNLAPGKNQLSLQYLANGIYLVIVKKDQNSFRLKMIKQ